MQNTVKTEGIFSHQIIEDMESDFHVETTHLIKVCDAFLSGLLTSESVESIAFCLVSSDHFYWDGESPDGAVCAEVIFDWSAPEINYEINEPNITRYKNYLTTHKDFRPEKPKLISNEGKLISVRHKN